MIRIVANIMRKETTIATNVSVAITQGTELPSDIIGVATTAEKPFIFSIEGNIDVREQDLIVGKSKTYRVKDVEEHGTELHPKKTGHCILSK